MNIKDTRPNELKTISQWLSKDNEFEKVVIYGMSGYGGIGKTYLLNEAIRQVKPENQGYLIIKVDGAEKSNLGEFISLIDQRFAPYTIDRGKRGYDYFPSTRKLVEKYRAKERQVTKEANSLDIDEKLNLRNSSKPGHFSIRLFLSLRNI